MNPTVKIEPINETYIKVSCPADLAAELSEEFRFEAPGARFSPKFKKKQWDGNIRLFTPTGRIYRGLIDRVVESILGRGLGVERIATPKGIYTDAFKHLNLPPQYVPRDYQIEAVRHCIVNRRSVIQLATGGGKSLVIYALARNYGRALIIVDSLNLIQQMASDFRDYGASDDLIHLIQGGSEKETDKLIVIATWQSLAKLPPQWFLQFDKDSVVIGDEAHGYDAKSLKYIMESLLICPHRFGLTGTLKNSKEKGVHRLILEGLFGPHKLIKGSAELIEEGFLSPVKVHCKVLRYSHEDRKKLTDQTNLRIAIAREGGGAKKQGLAGIKYQSEIEFIYAHPKRNKFIRDLAASLEGNTLLLFQRIAHGKELFEELQKEALVPVYYVAGEVEGEQREEIRKIINTHEDSITVASVGVFSKGVNIPKVNNIITASPSKSQVRVLQSIGRGLRKAAGKTICNIYDIADDLCTGRKKNYVYRHFGIRLQMFIREDFPYRLEYLDLDN